MKAAVLLFLVALVSACSSGGGATARADAGTPGLATPSIADAATADGGANAFRASGAKIRVVNLYSDGTGVPGPVEVYGDFQARGAPLMTVPFGSASDWFDPGIIDDQRNAQLSFFPAGKRTSDDLIIDQGETLKGTERITMIVVTGENKNSKGTLYGGIDVRFENGTLNPLPTPPAGQSLVILDLVGLAHWPGAGTDYMYLSAGSGCLNNLEAGSTTGVQPLSPARGSSNFSIPSGAQRLSLHTSDTCADKSPYPDIMVNLAAGQQAFLIGYSPDYRELHTLLLPVGN